MSELVNDEKDVEVVADMSDIDNPYDSVGYALISYHVERSKAQLNENKTKIQLHKERLIRRNARGRRR
jgi:chaperonin cofactor prefoldin